MTQNDDLVATRRELGRVNRCVVRFRAAVREERFFQPPGRDLRELFSQVALRLVGVKRRSVRNRLDLFDNRLVDFRVRVADADGQHAAEAIQITIACIVPDVHAFAAHERDRLLVIGRDGREEKLFMLADNFGLLGLWFGCAQE